MMNTLQIAQEVYVVGFPDSLVIAGALPIWKRGSVASEPDYPLGFRPSFLIDSAMRPGMSGAPVVGKFENPSYDNGGKGVLTFMGTRQGFCGMYSARIGAHLDGAQLGLVWHQAAIEKIIQSGIAGTPSNDFVNLRFEHLDEVVI